MYKDKFYLVSKYAIVSNEVLNFDFIIWFDKCQLKLVHKFLILTIIFFFTTRYIHLLWKINQSKIYLKYKPSQPYFQDMPTYF
jgi:hypothetical protein